MTELQCSHHEATFHLTISPA